MQHDTTEACAPKKYSRYIVGLDFIYFLQLFFNSICSYRKSGKFGVG